MARRSVIEVLPIETSGRETLERIIYTENMVLWNFRGRDYTLKNLAFGCIVVIEVRILIPHSFELIINSFNLFYEWINNCRPNKIS